MSDKWKLKHWSGSLELLNVESLAAGMDWQGYLQKKRCCSTSGPKRRGVYGHGQCRLATGDRFSAAAPFQSAYVYRATTPLFNEDARVQLHNIKTPAGARRVERSPGGGRRRYTVLGGRLRDLHGRKEVNYTQQTPRNSLIETPPTITRLHAPRERIVQQQTPLDEPRRAPRQHPGTGRVLTFKRSVVVDRLIDGTEDMKLSLQMRASPPLPGSADSHFVATLGILAASGWARKRLSA